MNAAISPSVEQLTQIPLKAKFYRRETYFREGLADFVAQFGAGARDRLFRTALMLIKADGLVSGKTSTILEFLAESGLRVASLAEVQPDGRQWREMWRYQLTSASLDRLMLNDLVLRKTGLLLLLSCGSALDLPASVLLSAAKGPSDTSLQPAHCLRRRLAQPNRVLSFIHVADEPADVAREFAILAGHSERRRLLAALQEDELPAEQAQLLEARRKSVRTIDLSDIGAALARVETRVRASIGARNGDETGVEVLACFERMRAGQKIEFRRFVDGLRHFDIHPDAWDLEMLGGAFTRYDDPGERKLIEAVDPALWRRAWARSSATGQTLSFAPGV